jgi:hypothetical protein
VDSNSEDHLGEDSKLDEELEIDELKKRYFADEGG